MTLEALEEANVSSRLPRDNRTDLFRAMFPDSPLWVDPINRDTQRQIIQGLEGPLRNNAKRALNRFRKQRLSPAELGALTDIELLQIKDIGPIGIAIATAAYRSTYDILQEERTRCFENIPTEDARKDLNFRMGELVRMMRFMYDMALRNEKNGQTQFTEAIDQMLLLSRVYTSFFFTDQYPHADIEEKENDLLICLLNAFNKSHIAELHSVFLPKEAQYLGGLESVEINEYVFHGIWPRTTVFDAIRAFNAEPNEFGAPFGLVKCLENRIADTSCTVQILSEQLRDIQFGKNVVVIGNAARGIIDAEIVAELLRQKGLEVYRDVYRYSPIKERDNKPQFLGRTLPFIESATDIIMVDSLSAGGRSVPGTLQECQRLNPNAVLWAFISQGGYAYRKTPEFTRHTGVSNLFFPRKPEELVGVQDAVLLRLTDVGRKYLK